MRDIDIKDGKKVKCPNCNNTILIENAEERLFRKTTLLYQNKKTGKHQIKCRQCNHMFEFIS